MCSLPLARDWTPAVSLIVPCRNEATAIGPTISTLLCQDYPGPIELIIADGLSTDATRDVIARLLAISPIRPTRPIPVHYITNHDRTTAAGLNLGIRAARGEVIFTLGAHTRYTPNYISGAIATMRRTGADAVGSCARTLPGTGSRVARAIAAALSSPFGAGDSRMRTGAHGLEPSAADTASCPGYRRHVFDRIGLFNPELVRNQDIEFNLRLRRAGMKLLLDPGILSQYTARATIPALAANCFANGYWVTRSLRHSRGAFAPRHLVPLLFLAASAAALLTSLLTHTSHLIIPAGLSAYLLAALILGRSFARPRDRLPLALPIFPLIHYSYGLGSLWGLLTLARGASRGARRA